MGGGKKGEREGTARDGYLTDSSALALELSSLIPAGMCTSLGMQLRTNHACGHPSGHSPPKHTLSPFCKWTLEGTLAGHITPNIVNFFFKKKIT